MMREIYYVLSKCSSKETYDSLFNISEYSEFPKNFKLNFTDDLSYAFQNCNVGYWLDKDNLRTICETWNTSHVEYFTGTFAHSTISTEIIQHMDVSKGAFFDSFFYDTEDVDDFKYLRNMDFSSSLSYYRMFEKCQNNPINYKNISKMKVNPNASFYGFFSELPRDSAEHFRRWFPDMSIDEIVKKLCKKSH